MDKNEVLEKSRNENKKGDEYEKNVTTTGLRIAVIVTAIVCFILYSANDGDVSYWLIIVVMEFVLSLYKAIKLKTKYNIISTIVDLILLGVLTASYLSSKGVF